MPKSPRRRPSLESLESRQLPATFGLPWPDPQHLTLSFMPDGTPVGGAPSTLNRTLDALMPDPAWRLDVLRAFQSWAVLANVNVGVVADSGQAPGRPGPLQGNPAFGDIRIGARPLSADTLALATPFDLLNNWSGDVLLNSQAHFGDGPKAPESLYNALLHEAGHVLGLPDNPTDPTSAMYTVNTGTHTAPSAADAAALRALYGPQATDARSNGTLATALPLFPASPGTPLAGLFSGRGAPTVLTSSGLVSLTDKDVYKVADLSPGAFGVDLRTSGISLLEARVTVFDASGRPLASAAASDPLHGDLAVTVPGASPGAVYYVQVRGATSDVFSIGSYRLAVGRPDQALQALSAPPAAPTAAAAGGEVVNLKPQTPGTDARWPYLVRGDLTASARPVDYGVKAAPAPGGVMLVTVWGDRPGGVAPRVTVFDGRHRPVATRVVAESASGETVQVLSPAAGARYVVEVSAASTTPGPWAHGGGEYTLGVTFRGAPVSADTLSAGTLSGAQNTVFLGLTVAEAELFHFDLSVGATPGTAVAVTIFDASGRPVESLNALGGAGGSGGDVVLPSGKYTVRIHGATRTGAPLPAVHYTLLGVERSDPIGPSLVDPTFAPIYQPPPTDILSPCVPPTSPQSPPTYMIPPPVYSTVLLDPTDLANYFILMNPYGDFWVE